MVVVASASIDVPGPVTTWMGDCLRTGNPSLCTVYPTTLSTQTSIPPGYVNVVPACLAGVRRESHEEGPL